MDTPVCSFIEKYKNEKFIRFHVPGHKGNENPCDITEIKDADVLYHEDGILAESQRNASDIFGTEKTVYSAEGSSLCIRAMLTLIKMYAQMSGRKPLIAAGRNAHKVFMTASALLGIDVLWLYPEERESVVSAEITPSSLEAFLENCEEKPIAVYITSPDYIGNTADIRGLSEVAHKHGVLLAVDNAHGAYLRFLSEDRHPITLGADICCDSAHKTLPVLTGGAYLHFSPEAPRYLAVNAQRAMSLFASTSPSYLILNSLDKTNRRLSEGYADEIRAVAERISRLKNTLSENGYSLAGDEPLKLSIRTKEYGYKGTDFSEILRNYGIECEFSDPDFVVMMISPENGADELDYLEKTLLSIERKRSISDEIPAISPCEQVIEIKDALFMEYESVSTDQAEGRILASPSVSCPPAVPIAICGERLNKNAVCCFKYYGIEKIDVVTE